MNRDDYVKALGDLIGLVTEMAKELKKSIENEPPVEAIIPVGGIGFIPEFAQCVKDVLGDSIHISQGVNKMECAGSGCWNVVNHYLNGDLKIEGEDCFWSSLEVHSKDDCITMRVCKIDKDEFPSDMMSNEELERGTSEFMDRMWEKEINMNYLHQILSEWNKVYSVLINKNQEIEDETKREENRAALIKWYQMTSSALMDDVDKLCEELSQHMRLLNVDSKHVLEDINRIKDSLQNRLDKMDKWCEISKRTGAVQPMEPLQFVPIEQPSQSLTCMQPVPTQPIQPIQLQQPVQCMSSQSTSFEQPSQPPPLILSGSAVHRIQPSSCEQPPQPPQTTQFMPSMQFVQPTSMEQSSQPIHPTQHSPPVPPVPPVPPAPPVVGSNSQST